MVPWICNTIIMYNNGVLGRLSGTFLSFIINKRARTVFKNIFNRTFRVHDPSSAIKFICKYKAENNTYMKNQM